MRASTVKSFRDLIAWQKAMTLCVDVCRLTRDFPKDEVFALASQLRRAAVSIPSNIAEGHGRRGRDDYKKFLGYAQGSLNETQTQLEIALRLKYVSQEKFSILDSQAREVERILSALIRGLGGRNDTP